MEPSQTIGQRIKAVRGDLSQKEFGARIGLSQTAVTALENDQSEPRLGTFNRIVLAFAVNPEWLRTGKERMPLDPFAEVKRAAAAMSPTAALSMPTGNATTRLSIAEPTREEYAALQEELRRVQKQLAETERELALKTGTLTAVEEDRQWLRSQIGGKAEASADAADEDDQPPVMVASTNHEYVAPPAVQERPYVAAGFVWGR